MLILIDSTPYLWLDETRWQQKPQIASRDRLVVTSYCDFTIFPASMALTVCDMSIIATTPLATISLYYYCFQIPLPKP